MGRVPDFTAAHNDHANLRKFETCISLLFRAIFATDLPHEADMPEGATQDHALGKDLIPAERIENRIILLRGQKVMLSGDLAALYEVEPRVLVQAVKRNAERFPDDFMFQLDLQEVGHLKSQFVTSSWGGRRFRRYYVT